ncbi:DUF1194 domain-containing protein [Pseudooceanicola nanhaiensis]|uniref:DUF1194 domain-containing protein n=1 Tax=Pseudooceanicola nanhaiensis TaxID=375761 RepID=UPI001CD21B65|nr:DUF1194 domain-containing protein [Pseudooceanicola nanhaiensis]MCA0922415.1 DUF1194 domain-containing protein [Pseudooceanicola nanhaiensis]
MSRLKLPRTADPGGRWRSRPAPPRRGKTPATRRLPALLLALLFAGPAAAQDCRLALALALDVSGSVDPREYRLQLDGVAAALQNPQVRAAFAAIPEAPVALAIYEWSGPEFQRLLVDWRRITGPEAVDAVAAQLRATLRQRSDPSTAIGAALQAGQALMQGAPRCWREVIDLSGDGKSNTGPDPRQIGPTLDRAGITVNGLVIGDAMDPPDGLQAYFRAYVLHGPGAFVESAIGFQSFEAAMVRKLLREMEVLAVSRAEPAAR